MNKGLIIGIGVTTLLVGGYFIYQYVGNKKFDNQCTSNGGIITKSGSSCDFLNCDKSKYPCNFYGLK